MSTMSTPGGLSFVTLLSYDYRYAFDAVRSYYAIADQIILGLDRDHLTWSGQPFQIDMAELGRFISATDTRGIIRVVEDNFHSFATPLENDRAERSVLSLHATEGNWIVQIDCDELMADPAGFRNWLLAADPRFGYAATWISVFKVFDGGRALVIEPSRETTPVASKLRGQYIQCRWTPQQYQLSPLRLWHFSWGRTEDILTMKLRNWGHSDEFDTEKYLAMWRSVTLENYHTFHYFHPLNPPMWPRLRPVQFRTAT